ncbi:MAG: PolC-type DNA polymerase III [Bacillota bacterium]
MSDQMNPVLRELLLCALGRPHSETLQLDSVRVWPSKKWVDISFFCEQAVPDEMIEKIELAFAGRLPGFERIRVDVRCPGGEECLPDAQITGDGTDEYSLDNEKDEEPIRDDDAPVYAFVRVEGANGRENGGNGDRVILGSKIRSAVSEILSVNEETGRITVQGMVLDAESRVLKSGRRMLRFDITDLTSSLTVKVFEQEKTFDRVETAVKKGVYLCVRGDCSFDRFLKETVLNAQDIELRDAPVRKDESEQKRIELHLHTQMSSMDGITNAKDAVRLAHAWGHAGIAITDHGVLQAFPDVYAAAKKMKDFKVVYGVEAYLVDDTLPIVRNSDGRSLDSSFVVFDVETTGLNPSVERLTEIGAVRVEDGRITGTFQTFVNPGIPIPPRITQLTGITQQMVQDAPAPAQAISDFARFAEGACLVAHNAGFDMSFILAAGREQGLTFDQPVLDTLSLSRQVWTGLKTYRLDAVAKHLKIDMGHHHRASDDAHTTAVILQQALLILKARNATTLNDINSFFSGKTSIRDLPIYHVILLASTQTGIKNLYKLISRSHIDYFHYKPRLPKTLLAKNREGILLGSACEQGELYRALLRGAEPDALRALCAFYDYFEIQPLANNEFLIRRGEAENLETLRGINRRIVALGREYGKPVVATGDVHYLHPGDGVYRKVLLHAQKLPDAELQPPLHLKTTAEMLEEFSYLGEETAMEVVVSNPAKILDAIGEVTPFLYEGFYAPKMNGVDDEIRSSAFASARSVYGDPLPEIIEKRLEKELGSIITHGYAVLYSIAQKMVRQSAGDGYLVGSRGSVGSSLAATMLGITEVNPLPPHYVCPACKFSDFDVDTSKYGIGSDMPDRDCPNCGTLLNKDGYDIPFEVFLGFEGNKVPDIDLNFSGEYQATAHKHIEELFGKEHVFRAGTISTIGERIAEEFARAYCEEKGLIPTKAEIKRLAQGCIGVKRTTGQHPGGIMIVPRDMDIMDFSPLQHPADAKDTDIITTHFDFNSLHDNLVKLDMLGHDDPTVLRMLQKITGTDPRTIKTDDPQTMRIFSSVEPLGIRAEDIGCTVGTLGVPEFGTRFVRQILEETRPTTMAELVRISGLSHGENLWIGNARELIQEGVTTLSKALCTRDDIMNQLMQTGMDALTAFNIMESVRKGKGLSKEMQQAMAACGVQDWFVESCQKIKYMFPKAHAAAYVMMAFRIAYYKVHYPLAFYASYFSVRADEFDATIMLGGGAHIAGLIEEYRQRAAANKRDQKVLTILEIVLEMNLRGISFLPVDVEHSDATRFLIEGNAIRPPFSALPGVGENAARSMQAAREQQPFRSVEDLQSRAHVSRAVIETLRAHGCFHKLPQSDQLSLF